MSGRCVFCRILLGYEPAQWVVREREAASFLPLPATRLAPGHALVVPRRHCIGVFDADPADLAATIHLVRRVAQAMATALGATGVVVLNASGPASGQTVDHLHFHVVPCWPDDGATYWPTDRSAHRLEGDPREQLADALSPGT